MPGVISALGKEAAAISLAPVLAAASDLLATIVKEDA